MLSVRIAKGDYTSTTVVLAHRMLNGFIAHTPEPVYLSLLGSLDCKDFYPISFMNNTVEFLLDTEDRLFAVPGDITDSTQFLRFRLLKPATEDLEIKLSLKDVS